MKVKNLNFAEKYIEKVIFGVAVLFSLAVVGLKFFSTPYDVDIKGQSLKPDQVEPAIKREADRLQQALTGDVPFKIPSIPPITRDFVAKINEPVADWNHRLYVGPLGPPMKGGDSVGPLVERYGVPTPPPAAELRLAQGYGVLGEPAQDQQTQGFTQLIGSQRPWDFRWVSVSGVYDMEQWRGRLEVKPQERGFQRIPEEWWRDMLALADVMMERQRWNHEKQDWDSVETIGPLPNNVLSHRNAPPEWAPTDAKQTVAWIKEHQREISKPPFPTLSVGFWLRPDVNLGALPPNRQNAFFKIRAEIERLQREINAAAANEAGAAAGGPGAMAPGMPGGPGAPGAAAVPPVPPPAAAPAARGGRPGAAAQGGPMTLKQMTDQLKRLEYEQDQILGLGPEFGFRPAEPNPAAAGGAPVPPPVNPGPANNQITVWGHDISVQPGETYRYRLRVAVLNPLFKIAQVPVEQQKDTFEKLVLLSAESEWSSPITIEPRNHFFLVGADQGRHTANIEVFGIFNGRRIYRTFEPQAGDGIGSRVEIVEGGFKSLVDMSTDAVVVDLEYAVPTGGNLAATTARMIYLNSIQNQLSERIAINDKNNEYYRQLRAEADAGRNQQAPQPVASKAN